LFCAQALSYYSAPRSANSKRKTNAHIFNEHKAHAGLTTRRAHDKLAKTSTTTCTKTPAYSVSWWIHQVWSSKTIFSTPDSLILPSLFTACAIITKRQRVLVWDREHTASWYTPGCVQVTQATPELNFRSGHHLADLRTTFGSYVYPSGTHTNPSTRHCSRRHFRPHYCSSSSSKKHWEHLPTHSQLGHTTLRLRNHCLHIKVGACRHFSSVLRKQLRKIATVPDLSTQI
jgi:hypothetical protein